MASKQFYLESVGLVTIAKKPGNRHIRLRVSPKGEVKVSLPSWVAYQAGVSFVHKNLDWISKQQAVSSQASLKNGDQIGKYHRLVFVSEAVRVDAVKTRLTPTEVRISTALGPESATAQTKAAQACERALKAEGIQLLPQRLTQLAKTHGYKYGDVAIKRLTTRWGSCSTHNNIVLSSYLIQLPWHLIDYVLVHELVHTVHKHHQAAFWDELTSKLPAAKLLRKELKHWRPTLLPNSR